MRFSIHTGARYQYVWILIPARTTFARAKEKQQMTTSAAGEECLSSRAGFWSGLDPNFEACCWVGLKFRDSVSWYEFERFSPCLHA